MPPESPLPEPAQPPIPTTESGKLYALVWRLVNDLPRQFDLALQDKARAIGSLDNRLQTVERCLGELKRLLVERRESSQDWRVAAFGFGSRLVARLTYGRLVTVLAFALALFALWCWLWPH